MNAERLRAVAKKLRRLRDPRRYEQMTFGRKSAECGTTACIAGHAVLMFEPKSFILHEPDVIEERGQSLLDLTDEEAGLLFTGDPGEWPEEFAERWRHTYYTADDRERRNLQRHIAADLLDALADGRVTL